MSYFQHSGELPAWIGNPPAGWETDWLKWHVRLLTERPTDEEAVELPYIANEDISSWTGKLLNPDPQPADADSRKFQPDDILFNKLRPYLAKVYHASFAGVSSGELLCLRGDDRVIPRYLFYVVSSKAFVDTINAETFGSKMPRADWETVGHQPLPLPLLETQRRIAAFLDGKSDQINNLIAQKQALMERLAEKRQAIITQAVTKGLNPSVSMKDSGIDWLGDIPAHWEAKRLKYISPRVTVGIVVTPAAYYADEGILALRGLNIKAMRFDFSDTRNITPEGHKLNIKSMLKTGDLVAVRTGAPGTTAVIPQELEGTNCIDLVIIRRPLGASEQYLGWFLNSDIAQTQYAMGAEGALQQHFNVETSKEVILTLPPFPEQVDIAAYIDRAIAAHDIQADKVQQSVDTLIEYRSALVNAAVTGQIAGLQ
ncbi:MAG TPA: restriction endonuclease subunit S [Edaphobacter sp.]|uniref:restriction endonuclease subunit S n=1 Tax=Edaphobacter sp. TaxID=1934404 RepID=UPI002CDCD01F|nr:restriction endonuclease subunit S [Edaphobacter sp.]HUZ97211.1 restriction endonuclease subunit S [Edaphobacter sp.]